MFNLINPSKVFYWIEKLINFINSIFFVLLMVALTFALLLSPPDYIQGDSVRIMYVHVPAAWIGLASFTSTNVYTTDPLIKPRSKCYRNSGSNQTLKQWSPAQERSSARPSSI